MPREDLGLAHQEFPINRAVLLHNETCVYCGKSLSRSDRTKEHVIGRRFIPRGKLAGQWNLIVWSCEPCNKWKSELEDDLSAISMHPDAWGRHAIEDDNLAAEAIRKAQNSTSRRTGKPVKDSAETITLKMPIFQGGEMTFTLTCPPQAEPARIFELARLHLVAFFYWVTYNNSTRRGGYWLGEYFPVLETRRADWGNAIHRAFMEVVLEWEPRVFATTADGHFKIVIRRHPDAICWSWALEWNHSYRIVGFFGERAPVETLIQSFPSLQIGTVAQWPNGWLRSRREVPLQEEEDTLFCWNDTKLA